MRTVRELKVTPAHHQERQEPQQQPGPQNDRGSLVMRIRSIEPPLADSKKWLWVVEANWSASASQVARTGEGGLAVRVQLRRA